MIKTDKSIAWEVISGLLGERVKRNCDFTFMVDDHYRLEINVPLRQTEEEVMLNATLYCDNGPAIYYIEGIPADDIWQVTDGLDAIINNLKSKIITAADKELQENDGFMWLSFNQFLSHLSRVTNMYK